MDKTLSHLKDSWIPRPPSFLPITQGVDDEMKVAEIIQQSGKWNSELIKQFYLNPDSQLILTIPLSPFNHSNFWLWHYNKNVIYPVKNGYNLAIKMGSFDPSSSSDVISAWWKAFWTIKIPRKILFFARRGYHEILTTTKGSHRINVSTYSSCPVCGFGKDSNGHAIFWCPFSQNVWVLMDYPFLVGHKEEISFKDVLLYATKLLEKEEFAKLLITITNHNMGYMEWKEQENPRTTTKNFIKTKNLVIFVLCRDKDCTCFKREGDYKRGTFPRG